MYAACLLMCPCLPSPAAGKVVQFTQRSAVTERGQRCPFVRYGSNLRRRSASRVAISRCPLQLSLNNALFSMSNRGTDQVFLFPLCQQCAFPVGELLACPAFVTCLIGQRIAKLRRAGSLARPCPIKRGDAALRPKKGLQVHTQQG